MLPHIRVHWRLLAAAAAATAKKKILFSDLSSLTTSKHPILASTGGILGKVGLMGWWHLRYLLFYDAFVSYFLWAPKVVFNVAGEEEQPADLHEGFKLMMMMTKVVTTIINVLYYSLAKGNAAKSGLGITTFLVYYWLPVKFATIYHCVS